MESLVANLLGQGKKTTLKGREYFVAPMTLICPGVLNGSRGPLLYPSDEIAKSYKSWNGIPLVIDHPVRDGQPISAREVVEDHVGFIKNSRIKDGKLQADGWFDIENLKRVNEAVWTRLESNEPIELSTGLQTSNEEVQPGTTFNGVLYSHVARNHRPDHLAVLPTARGACSLNDGCGVLVNELLPDQRGACSLNDGCGLHVNQEGNVENCGGKGGKPGPCKTSLEDEFDSGKSGLLMTPDRLISEHKTLESFKKIAEQHGLRIKEMSHPSGVGVHYVAKDKEGNWRGKFDPEATHNSEELLCTNCDASGECEECKKKRLKKVSDEAEVAAIGDGMTDNEMSHDDLRQKLHQLVNEKYGTPLPSVSSIGSPIPSNNLYINDVFDKDFVYQDGLEQYRLGYSTDLRNGTVTLSEGAPVRVTVKKSYVANEQREFLRTLNCGGEGGKPGPCSTGGGMNVKGLSLKTTGSEVAAGTKVMVSKSATMKKTSQKYSVPHRHAGRTGTVIKHNPKLGSVEMKFDDGGTVLLDHSKVVHNKQTHNVGLKSVVNTLRKEADMAGKLSAEDREKLVDSLVENSGFQAADTWEEKDREVLNAMSDEKLYSLAVAKQTLIDQQSVVNAVGKHVGKHNLEDLPAAVENAFKPFKKKTDDEDMEDESDDEEAEGETTNMDHSIRVPRQLTEAEFMKMAPPSIRQDLEYSRAIQNKEKQELIGTITANVSGDELDQAVNYLRTKPLAELRIIANVTSKTAAPEYDVNIRRSPNYGGMAVPSQSRMTTNKRPGEGPRPVTIPWGDLSKQV